MTQQLEKLVRIVRGLGRPKMRLSCRAADWLGNTDLQESPSVSAGQQFFGLASLEPLTEVQILHITQSHYSWGNAQHFYQRGH